MTETQPKTSPESPTPTLAQVARQAGVSKATASRALGSSPTRVDPETAKRVRMAAAELRYTPNPHARALARSSSPSVGLLIHEVSNPFFSEIATGVLAAAERHDRMVMITNTRRDPAHEIRYVAEMRAMRVHAILLAGSEFVDDGFKGRLDIELDEYRRLGGRVVLMRPHPKGPVVVPDIANGGRLMAEHLLALGHRKIGVVAGPHQLATIQERLTAFEERLLEDNVTPAAVIEGDFSRQGGYESARKLLVNGPDVTAIFALNDLMGVGAIHAARDLGLDVPDDISVAGFNDIPSALDVSPPLTTIRLPLREMGERALDIAMAEDLESTEPVVLEVKLISRASTASPAP